MVSYREEASERPADGFEFYIDDGQLKWRWWGEPKLTHEQAAIIAQATSMEGLERAMRELAAAVSSIADWMPENVAERTRVPEK